MKQNLGHVVLTRLCCEVARHRDAFLPMVALTKPGGGSIEEEVPVVIEPVHREEASGFRFYPHCVGHQLRVAW